MSEERQIVQLEKYEFQPGTGYMYYHPECFEKSLFQGQPYLLLPHTAIGQLRCACGISLHQAPVDFHPPTGMILYQCKESEQANWETVRELPASAGPVHMPLEWVRHPAKYKRIYNALEHTKLGTINLHYEPGWPEQ